MEIELLHIHHGDKRKRIDTSVPEGRNEVERLLKNLCAQKCAVFLERGKKTYRVVGYDKEADKLIVETGKGKRKKQEHTKLDAETLATCRVEAAQARVAAVAPVAGGDYSEQDDQVVLTMTRDDYCRLLIALGEATFAALKRDGLKARDERIMLVNRLNRGNPNFEPYEIPQR